MFPPPTVEALFPSLFLRFLLLDLDISCFDWGIFDDLASCSLNPGPFRFRSCRSIPECSISLFFGYNLTNRALGIVVALQLQPCFHLRLLLVNFLVQLMKNSEFDNLHLAGVSRPDPLYPNIFRNLSWAV